MQKDKAQIRLYKQFDLGYTVSSRTRSLFKRFIRWEKQRTFVVTGA